MLGQFKKIALDVVQLGTLSSFEDVGRQLVDIAFSLSHLKSEISLISRRRQEPVWIGVFGETRFYGSEEWKLYGTWLRVKRGVAVFQNVGGLYRIRQIRVYGPGAIVAIQRGAEILTGPEYENPAVAEFAAGLEVDVGVQLCVTIRRLDDE